MSDFRPLCSTLPPPNDNGDYGAEEVAKTFFSINSSTVPPHPPHRKDIYAPFQCTCLPAIGRAARLKPPPLYNLQQKSFPCNLLNFRSNAFRTSFAARQLTPALLESVFLLKIISSDRKGFVWQVFPRLRPLCAQVTRMQRNIDNKNKITRRKNR